MRAGARIGRGRRVVHRRALAVEVVVGGGEGAHVACRTQTTRRTRPGRGRDRGQSRARARRRRKWETSTPRTTPATTGRAKGRATGRARPRLSCGAEAQTPSLSRRTFRSIFVGRSDQNNSDSGSHRGDEEKRPGSARGSPQRSTRNHPGDDGVREFLFDSEFHTTSQSRKSVRIRGVLSSESRPLAGWRFFIRRESSRRSHVLLRVKASFWRLLLRPRPRAHRVVQE